MADDAVTQSRTKQDFQYTLHVASESGMRSFVPGKWASIDLSLHNGRSESRELLCTSYFGQNSQLQYGRQVWVPAQSTLHISQQLLIPETETTGNKSVELHSLVFDRSQSGDVLLRGEGDELRTDASLSLAGNPRCTGIIGPSYQQADWQSDAIEDLLIGCRVFLQIPNELAWFRDDFLPADDAALAPFDQMIVADDRIIHDFAAISALRRWMQSGGHVWVMLDRVDAKVAELLLGDEFTGALIDRTTLTEFQVDEVSGEDESRFKPGTQQNSETPVDFVHVAAEGFRVTHRVNDWPAAMNIPCGDGLLMVTTLGAQGWVRSHPEGYQQPPDPQMRSDVRLTESMTNVADEFFRLRKASPLKTDFVKPQAEEYIGYSIPSWSIVVGSLIGFSLCIIVIGLLLLRIDRLEQIFWAGTIPAIAVSLFLIQTGRANRQSIPGTIATVQMITASSGTDDLRSEGVLAVYHPDGTDAMINATQGGRLDPENIVGDKATLRVVTTDLNSWQWENFRQTAGVQSTAFTRSEITPERLLARVTFGASGATGKLQGLFSPGSDAMIVSRGGRMGLTMAPDGSFQGGQSDIFETEQYLSAGLLSDEQDRRRRTLKAILENPERPDFSANPHVLYWADARDNGFRFGEDLRPQGASLVTLPVQISRPADGTDIQIPSPFLEYHNRPSPDGTPSSAMWDPDKKQWQERSEPSVAWLRIPVSPELLPLTVSQLTMDLKVTGPIGIVEILGIRGGVPAGLQSQTNPVGAVTFEITDTETLKLDDTGALNLGIRAGIPAGSGNVAASPGDKVNYWKIESLALYLRATISETNAKE